MTTSISTFLGYRLYSNNITQSLENTAKEPANATATAYYNANIGNVTSVDDFVGNYKLFNYAMTAYGLSDMSYATAFMKKVLESDLSDPDSFVNKLSDPRYKAFAEAYQFQTDGSVASQGQIQTTSQQIDTIGQFSLKSTDGDDQGGETAYYTSHMPTIKNVGQLEADPTLYRYVLTAYGLDPSTTPESEVTQALEGQGADLGNAGLAAMSKDFNFTSTGAIGTPTALQSTGSMTATVTAYSAAAGFDTTTASATTDTAAQSIAKAATAYYQKTIPTITSMSQFLNNSQLTSYVIKAYGLPSNTTTAQLQSALTSDLSDPKSAANQLGSAFVTFAGDFNIGTNGSITQQSGAAVQDKAQLATTNSNYLWQSMETDAGNTYGTGVQLALYFRKVAPTITNSYSILADKALTEVVQTALGLSSESSSEDIDQQANYLTSKINFSDFTNPAKLDQFIDRFSALYDIQNNTTSNPVLQLFGAPASA